MKGAGSITVLLLLILVQNSCQNPVQDTEETSSTLEKQSNPLEDVKRHSEGTFTSDYSKYMDNRRAKDFVQWLMSTKRNGSISKRYIEPTRHTEGIYSNDIRSYMEAKAAKDFINWLIKGRGRREFPEESNELLNEVIPEEMDRRHADGTFTSEINVVLDTIAAKEFLNWLLNSKTVQSRDSEIEFFNEYK
ncbi:glucagon b [Carcharodon carcharias]|uniref:glucagon b n=1 Tax=Carcharodon carcharias TaxID=13397 RepID=UPI001B7EFF71|nr:glucagon b [Carcharodon carcharias]